MPRCLKNLIAIVVVLGVQSKVHSQESPIESSNDRFANKLELLFSKIDALENRIHRLEEQLVTFELNVGAVGFSDGIKQRTTAKVDHWIRTRGIEAAYKVDVYQDQTWRHGGSLTRMGPQFLRSATFPTSDK